MKKVILLVMIVMSFGCNIAYEVLDEYYEADMEGHRLYYSDEFENLESQDIVPYLKSNIEYDGSKGYQNLETSLNTGVGNCTSYAIAYANVLYYVTGIKANVIIVDGYSNSRSVVNGGFDSNHAIVELPDGTQIEPQNGKEYNFEVLYRYEFDLIF